VWAPFVRIDKMRAHIIALLILAIAVGLFPTSAAGARAPSPKPSPVAAVIQVTVIPVARAAAIVRELFPHVRVRTDGHANALVVVGSPEDVQSVRTVVSGVDVKNPTQPVVQVIQLHVLKPQEVVEKVAPLFPSASVRTASKTSVLVRATSLDSSQIQALISSLDVPPASAAPSTPSPVEAVEVKIANPRKVARAVASEVHGIRVSVSGSSVLLTGDPQGVTTAKSLIGELDTPPFGARYTEIYRIKNIDATSVGDLVHRTFPGTTVTVDKVLNAISVAGTASEQERIHDAIAQLDGDPSGQNAMPGAAGAAYGSSNVAVVNLNAAIPGPNDAPSTSAQDIATAVTQALSQMAPGLHVTVPANSSEIVLTGDPTSIRLAKKLIAKLDVTPPMVELDTEVLELDDTSARNIGLELPGAVLSTTFTEVMPTPDSSGIEPRIGKILPITRTGLYLTAQLNLLIQDGKGRVLADPRIATLSGHTASIRAGDTLAILTTTGGGVGTPVTQQLQTFNTGVTLDITPQVNSSGDIIVELHPVVNSLSGILNGVPQIATRDTQTVVHLHNNQTLVIGGLIQEEDTRSSQSIPILGQLPLIGGLFRNNDVNLTRNELVIVVTPHVIKDGESIPPPNATMGLPTAAPLPTLPPNTMLATASPTALPSTPLPPPVLSTPIVAPTPAPAPTPSAFAASNVFEYGTAPQNNYAGPLNSPQIYYARLQPTVLAALSKISVDAVTTTNVTRVTVGTLGRVVNLTQIGPGKWSASFPASQLALSSAQQTTMLMLNAYRSDGTAAAIQIPVSPLTH